MNSPDDLIPELPFWNNGIDIDAWIGRVGQHEHAIGDLARFWPTFAEHEGGVFLRTKPRRVSLNHGSASLFNSFAMSLNALRTGIASELADRTICTQTLSLRP